MHRSNLFERFAWKNPCILHNYNWILFQKENTKRLMMIKFHWITHKIDRKCWTVRTYRLHNVCRSLGRHKSNIDALSHLADDLAGMRGDFVRRWSVKCLWPPKCSSDCWNCPDCLGRGRVKNRPYYCHSEVMCPVSIRAVKSVPFDPLLMDPTLQIPKK